MYYLLNSAVITSPGTYRYRIVGAEFAKEWLDGKSFIRANADSTSSRACKSCIGYDETADALTSISGVSVPVNRIQIKMNPGDEALVFRLVFPPGTPRIPAERKGMLTKEFILENCEIGVLYRID